jgi:hypothetical protein
MGVEDNYFVPYFCTLNQEQFLCSPAGVAPTRAALWRTTRSNATQADGMQKS